MGVRVQLSGVVNVMSLPEITEMVRTSLSSGKYRSWLPMAEKSVLQDKMC